MIISQHKLAVRVIFPGLLFPDGVDSLVVYFLAAICTNMPPENMLPFAAQVVGKLVLLFQSENNDVSNLSYVPIIAGSCWL